MKQKLSQTVLELLESQKSEWQLCQDNFAALASVRTRELVVDSYPFKIQFNPARILSSTAKVDSKSIAERKCFLCATNRPKVQRGVEFIAESGNRYDILCNPFPIFREHFTIPTEHVDQQIKGRIGDMIDLTEAMEHFVLFYNGAHCGASAPDHMHFQAGNRGFLEVVERLQDENLETISDCVFTIKNFPANVLLIKSTDRDKSIAKFNKIYNKLLSLNSRNGQQEPMLNILCVVDDDQISLLVFPRKQHRPRQFFAEGNDNVLISPASIDLAGVIITPLQKDFEKITAEVIKDIIQQVTINNNDFEELKQAIMMVGDNT